MSLSQKYNYRRILPHIQKDCRPNFITFATYKRWRLPESARELVFQICLEEDGHMFDLHALAVMPDHVHLILTALPDRDGAAFSLPKIKQIIKGRSAHAVNAHLRRGGTVWQQECFDHVLRSNESLAAKVGYVVQNPVRAGLVNRAEEYRWVWIGSVPAI